MSAVLSPSSLTLATHSNPQRQDWFDEVPARATPEVEAAGTPIPIAPEVLQ